MLAIDETDFLKKGTKSVGVARQYPGTAGRIENCQIGVFLAYASPQGRAFLDRSLYLTKIWADDDVSRTQDGVPPEVTFATKGDLAQTMLSWAFAADVPAAWVTGDEHCALWQRRRSVPALEAQERPNVPAVARSHPVWRGGVQIRVDALLAEIPNDGRRRQQRSACLRLGVGARAVLDGRGLGVVASGSPFREQAGRGGLLPSVWTRRRHWRDVSADGRRVLDD